MTTAHEDDYYCPKEALAAYNEKLTVKSVRYSALLVEFINSLLPTQLLELHLSALLEVDPRRLGASNDTASSKLKLSNAQFTLLHNLLKNVVTPKDIYVVGLKCKLKAPNRGLATVIQCSDSISNPTITLVTDFGNVIKYNIAEFESEVQETVGIVKDVKAMFDTQIELLESAKLLISN